MAKFKVDTDILQDTISTYASAIEDIETAVKDAQEAINVLIKAQQECEEMYLAEDDVRGVEDAAPYKC